MLFNNSEAEYFIDLNKWTEHFIHSVITMLQIQYEMVGNTNGSIFRPLLFLKGTILKDLKAFIFFFLFVFNQICFLRDAPECVSSVNVHILCTGSMWICKGLTCYF